jgi:hypothetical protein
LIAGLRVCFTLDPEHREERGIAAISDTMGSQQAAGGHRRPAYAPDPHCPVDSVVEALGSLATGAVMELRGV